MIDKLVFDNNFLPTTAVVHKINEIIDIVNMLNKSPENPKMRFYAGKNIEAMTREELIDAVITLGELYQNSLSKGLM